MVFQCILICKTIAYTAICFLNAFNYSRIFYYQHPRVHCCRTHVQNKIKIVIDVSKFIQFIRQQTV